MSPRILAVGSFLFLAGIVVGRFGFSSDPISSNRIEGAGRTVKALAAEDDSAAGGDPLEEPLSTSRYPEDDATGTKSAITVPPSPVAAVLGKIENGSLGLSEIESFLSAIQGLSGEELVEEIGKLEMSSLSGMQSWMIPVLLSIAISEAAPEHALELYLDDSVVSEIRQGLGAMLFAQWGSRAPEQALAAIERIANPAERKMALGATLMSIATTDPARALREYRSQPNLEDQFLVNIFRQWGLEDPSGAQEALASLSTAEQIQATRGLVQGLAASNPDLAIRLISGLELAPNESNRMFAQVINGVASNNFGEAVLLLDRVTDPIQRAEIVRDSIWNLVRVDFEQTLSLVETLPDGGIKSETIQRMVGQLASVDPVRAVVLVDRIPFGNAYRNAVSNLASNWVRSDPDAALAWMAQLPEGEERDGAYRNAFNHLAKSDPDRAFAMIDEVTGVERRSLVEAIASFRGRTDPKGTLEWVRAFGDDDLNEAATRNVINQWARSDPIAAIAYFAERGETGILEQHIGSLISRWANRDVSGAADWALQLDPGKTKERALESVAREWLSQDTYSASIWISGIEDKSTRDQLVSILIDRTYRSEPASAFEWAITLEEGKQQTRQLRRVVDQMVTRGNAEDARNLVNGAGLSSELRDQLLKLTEPKP